MHEHEGGLWERYIDLITDPAHLMLEGTLVLVIDVLIGLVFWPLIKRWAMPRFKKALDEYHVEHDAEHHAGHTTGEHDGR